jgi:hypothetical protein
LQNEEVSRQLTGISRGRYNAKQPYLRFYSDEDALLYALLLGSAATFFPLGVYCYFLSRINRRLRPLMVYGVWDFAAVLFAVSGLLLFVGPSLLTGFRYEWRELWIKLNYPSLRGPGPTVTGRWLVYWYLYFGVIVVTASLLLWRRRLFTVVYNIKPAALEEALSRTLDSLGILWMRSGPYILIGHRIESGKPWFSRTGAAAAALPAEHSPHASGLAQSSTTAVPDGLPATNGEPSALREYRVLVTLNPFESFRHVTLYWPDGATPVRQAVETELAAELARVRTVDNPIGRPLLYIAAVILVSLFGTVAIIQSVLLSRPLS